MFENVVLSSKNLDRCAAGPSFLRIEQRFFEHRFSGSLYPSCPGLVRFRAALTDLMARLSSEEYVTLRDLLCLSFLEDSSEEGGDEDEYEGESDESTSSESGGSEDEAEEEERFRRSMQDCAEEDEAALLFFFQGHIAHFKSKGVVTFPEPPLEDPWLHDCEAYTRFSTENFLPSHGGLE